MVSALVTVATGATQPLLGKLTKLLEEEHSKLKGVHREAQYIRDEMRTMGATLQELADSEELGLGPGIKIWRDDLRDLSYEMEDCIDRFTVRVDQQQGDAAAGYTRLQKFFHMLKQLKPRHEIANEIQQLKARAAEISERHKRYKFAKPTPNSDTRAIDPRLQALYVEVDKLVGIDGPQKEVTEKLQMDSSSTQLKVVSIVGSGGLGKTTLANQVYKSIKRDKKFQCMAFVSVSRNPDTRKILRDIAQQVGATLNTSDDDVKPLIDKLRDHLQDKRYFVVIDDVWDTSAWVNISLALPSNNQGSRIITTTRNVKVASCCSSQGDPYKMKPLSSDDSKRLLYKRVFNSEDLCYPQPHLEEVSNEILKKCAGLPLAIITMSSLLAEQSAKDEWERVLTVIGSAIAKDPSAETMTKIISLSYFDLPHHLRTCLLYLSLFPEDYIINKHRLISRWIAEGFVHEEQGRSMYEVGEGYFNDLVNRSLIYPVDVKCGQAEACRVHDIILDFITCKAAEENFVTSADARDDGKISGHKVRWYCIETGRNEQVRIPTRLILSHVRSFTVLGEFVQNSLLDFSAVRVLDLGDCWWLEGHHIEDILKLSLLKYLHLGKSSIGELPREIGELQNLQTLDIRHIRTRELPSTITKLQQLARLFVRQGTRFPDGIIGQMKSLEELEEYSVFSDEQAKSLKEFGQLSKMRTLKVAWCADRSDGSEGRSKDQDLQCYVRSLTSSCLHHLYFINSYCRGPEVHALSLESWGPTISCSLRKLHIAHSYIDKVPNWMDLLENLRELKLYIYRVILEDFAILGAMPALLSLELSILHGANERMFIHGFRSLKHLELKFSRGGDSTEFEEGSMRKLDQLKLEFAVRKSGFPNGPSDFGIKHLSALTKADVSIHNDSDGTSRLSADDVARLIGTAVRALPNHPTLSLQTGLKDEKVDEEE